MSKKLLPLVRRRVSAFFGATAVVAVLWLVTVLSVGLFAPSPPLGVRDGRFVNGAERLPRGPSPHKDGPGVVFRHNTGFHGLAHRADSDPDYLRGACRRGP